MQTPLRFNELYYQGDSYRIHYRLTNNKGAKSLCVCLHGYGGNASAWDETLTQLNDGSRDFLTIDLPEHGLSTRVANTSSLSLPALIEDLYAIIRSVKRYKETLVMGHCFGGIIVILLAATHPDVADRLVLINSGYSLPPLFQPLTNGVMRKLILGTHAIFPPYYRTGMASYTGFKNTSDFNIRRLLTDYFYVGPKYYFLLATLFTNIDLSKTIKLIRIPTLIVASENDRIFPLSYSKKFAQMFNDGTFVMLPHQNHISIINDPVTVAHTIGSYT